MSNPSIAVEVRPSIRTSSSQLASATVRLTTDLGAVTIHDVRVLKNKSGVTWIALPSFSLPTNGRSFEYHQTIELAPELFEQVSIEVLRTYRIWSDSQNETKSQPQEVSSNVQPNYPR